MSRFLRENWILITVSLAVVLAFAAWLVLRTDDASGVYPIY
jgi:hypothetical protein